MNTNCPSCGVPDIAGDSITIDGEWALQTVECLGCDATWTDHYRLHHRTDENGTEIEGPDTTGPTTLGDLIAHLR